MHIGDLCMLRSTCRCSYIFFFQVVSTVNVSFFCSISELPIQNKALLVILPTVSNRIESLYSKSVLPSRCRVFYMHTAVE